MALRIARYLLGFVGLVWTGFGVASLARITTNWPGSLVSGGVLALFMFANGAIFIWLARRIGKGERWVYYFGLLFLAVNLVFTLTDEFGSFDALTLALDALTFGLLLAARPGKTSGAGW